MIYTFLPKEPVPVASKIRSMVWAARRKEASCRDPFKSAMCCDTVQILDTSLCTNAGRNL